MASNIVLVGFMGCGKSVSYTHLDVYKRQERLVAIWAILRERDPAVGGIWRH